MYNLKAKNRRIHLKISQSDECGSAAHVLRITGYVNLISGQIAPGNKPYIAEYMGQ